MSGIVGGNQANPASMALYQKPIVPIYNKFGKRVPPPMVVLPKHLIPRKLGGTGDGDSDDFEEELTNAQVRDKYSTFKKRRGKEEIKKEAEKQAKDAQFLDGLFNDNLSEDTDIQEQVR